MTPERKAHQEGRLAYEKSTKRDEYGNPVLEEKDIPYSRQKPRLRKAWVRGWHEASVGGEA